MINRNLFYVLARMKFSNSKKLLLEVIAWLVAFGSEFLAVNNTALVYSLSSPPSPAPSPLLTQCNRCLDDCVGAPGWVAGIASHGSIILPWGRLVTMEAPGYPGHPSSIQHNAVVKLSGLIQFHHELAHRTL